jgi:hypothetical protein
MRCAYCAPVRAKHGGRRHVRDVRRALSVIRDAPESLR